MRGFDLLVGYILGNESARKWIISKLRETSLALDNVVKENLGEKNENVRRDNGESQSVDRSC